jgi:hypothetical protein
VVKTQNSNYFCEAANMNAILVVISLFCLPLPVAIKVALVCCCSLPAFCTAENEEGERWHWDYWEDVGRLKKMKITKDIFTLYVLCCILFLLYLRNIGDLQIILCAERLSYLVTLYLHLYLVLVFTNLSEVHWHGSTICASENCLRTATIIFAVSVFPSVCPAIKRRGKRGFA